MSDSDVTVTLCYCVLFCFCIYLLIHAYYIYIKAKYYYEKDIFYYNKKEFEILVDNSILVLQNYVNYIAHPYFYSYPINYILNRVPRFIHVIKLSKFMLDNSVSTNDLHNLLKRKYGPNFEHSDNLNKLVKVKMPYGFREYYHYIVTDFNKTTLLYLQNKAYLEKVFYIH